MVMVMVMVMVMNRFTDERVRNFVVLVWCVTAAVVVCELAHLGNPAGTLLVPLFLYLSFYLS